MKFALSVLALSGAAFGSTILERQVETIVGVVNKIEKATAAFDSAIKSFSSDASQLKSASKEVTDTVSAGVSTVNGASSITLTDSVKIQGQVSNLQSTVESVVTDLISKKEAIIAAGEGASISKSLQDQLTGAKALQVAISSKVPPEVQSLAQQLSAGINTSLEKGVAAFAGASGSSSSGSSSSGSSSSDSSDMSSMGMGSSSGSSGSSGSSSTGSTGTSSGRGSSSGSYTSPKAAVSTTSAPKPATFAGAAAPRSVAGSFAGVLAICAAIFVL